MRGWLLFDREVADGVPEAAEIGRFIDVAKRRNVRLDVLRPRDFELIVSTERAWRAEYARGRLTRPDFIIPRTGSETTYFTLAVIRQFERMGVPLINGAEAVEACADKLQSLQLLSASGLPIPKTSSREIPCRRGRDRARAWLPRRREEAALDTRRGRRAVPGS
jgi:gamma-F420-2:alpha-L-glutamate ligase